MNKWLLPGLLSLLGIAGTVLCALQFAKTFAAGRYGSLLFWMFLTTLSLETAVFPILRRLRERKKT